MGLHQAFPSICQKFLICESEGSWATRQVEPRGTPSIAKSDPPPGCLVPSSMSSEHKLGLHYLLTIFGEKLFFKATKMTIDKIFF